MQKYQDKTNKSGTLLNKGYVKVICRWLEFGLGLKMIYNN